MDEREELRRRLELTEPLARRLRTTRVRSLRLSIGAGPVLARPTDLARSLDGFSRDQLVAIKHALDAAERSDRDDR
jgi:hypothetical protein